VCFLCTSTAAGGYFTSVSAALKHYPAWATAAELYAQHSASLPASSSGITFFVPSDAAFAAVAARLSRLPSAAVLLSGDDASVRARAKLVAALPAAEVSKVLAGHMSAPAVALSTSGKQQLTSLAAAGGWTIQVDVSSNT
jgi:hypothetical protein